jgi:preprotein translocase subunit SecA
LHGRARRLFDPSARLHRQAREASRQCEALDRAAPELVTAHLRQARDRLRRDPLQAQGHLMQVLGLVGQISLRTTGLRPYPVQYMGALALHEGLLAEMATGEGKTLTVAMAGVLAGLTGRPCHVITANDYLAERDAGEMRALYEVRPSAGMDHRAGRSCRPA